MRAIFYHEDDYCQIELLPISNWNHCVAQLGQLDAFAEAHSDGIGWTEMFIRDENPQPIASLHILTPALTVALSPILPAYDQVLTGISSYFEEAPHTLAFGSETACVVFASYDAQNVVQAIWLDLGLDDENGKMLASAGLAKLAELGDLMLVDWNRSQLARLSDADEIKLYLDALREGRRRSGNE